MNRVSKITVYVLVPGLIAFEICMIAFALTTGQVRGKFDWIYCADDPVLFWNWVIGYVIGTASLVLFLCAVHYRARR